MGEKTLHVYTRMFHFGTTSCVQVNERGDKKKKTTLNL